VGVVEGWGGGRLLSFGGAKWRPRGGRGGGGGGGSMNENMLVGGGGGGDELSGYF